MLERVHLRYIVGAMTILVIAGLVYSQSIDSKIGIAIIIAILAALGIYEGTRV